MPVSLQHTFEGGHGWLVGLHIVPVVLANAGTQSELARSRGLWVPAFARTTGESIAKSAVWARIQASHNTADTPHAYSGIPSIRLNGNVSASDIPMYSEGFASGIA